MFSLEGLTPTCSSEKLGDTDCAGSLVSKQEFPSLSELTKLLYQFRIASEELSILSISGLGKDPLMRQIKPQAPLLG